jgi:hypothetical protein
VGTDVSSNNPQSDSSRALDANSRILFVPSSVSVVFIVSVLIWEVLKRRKNNDEAVDLDGDKFISS